MILQKLPLALTFLAVWVIGVSTLRVTRGELATGFYIAADSAFSMRLGREGSAMVPNMVSLRGMNLKIVKCIIRTIAILVMHKPFAPQLATG